MLIIPASLLVGNAWEAWLRAAAIRKLSATP